MRYLSFNTIWFTSIIILLFFFYLFLVISNSFFIIPVAKENTRAKSTLAIPAGTPVKLVKEIIHIYLLVADKTIKVLSKQSKAAMYLISILPNVFLSWISQLH